MDKLRFGTTLARVLHKAAYAPIISQRSLHLSKWRRAGESADKTDIVLRHDLEFGVTILTLNNPAKRNALSSEMMGNLGNALIAAYKTPETKVIIVKAEGKVFSAGHDLRQLVAENGRDMHRAIFEQCSEMMKLVQDLPIPVIAQVNGLATAAGCQLVASCDIAIASENSRFATPGVHVGLFCSTPAVAVGRSVPRKVAMEMLFTGEPISAQEALLYGLVSRVTPEDKLEDTTLSIAAKIASKSRPVISMGKATFNKQMTMDRDGAYCVTTDTMVENTSLVDCQEGINAFIEKREPSWTNKYQQVVNKPKE
ncbi:enoyl-CoA hydratase domain-containing protein 3, mitochondrial-like [Watersipora subatra]|uniref:enoyl-CoA hydratase domain-containing protein 3, mitochondrial-like n=1 Tax=Watersipora subatra TaxID=2589382 RepID=UPI00355AEF5D